MLHLVFCVGIWTLISAYIFWRLIAIATKAFNHLKRLHQIPCSQCAYFTGDYRLKCTVNPMIVMSETAIDCRDFINSDAFQLDFAHRQTACSGCLARKNHNLQYSSLN